jgi:hypothetical protein
MPPWRVWVAMMTCRSEAHRTMSKPLYFDAESYDRTDADATLCYTIKRHLDLMEMSGEAERKLYRARPEVGTSTRYCTEFDASVERGEWCGRLCDAYEPRNGKNGLCRHSVHCYDADRSEVKVIRLPKARLQWAEKMTTYG